MFESIFYLLYFGTLSHITKSHHPSFNSNIFILSHCFKIIPMKRKSDDNAEEISIKKICFSALDSKEKGKSVVVDREEDEQEDCGICFISKAHSRGKLDCCDHFYCFTCIKEWSKVETRCPACRQRFSSILRISFNGSKDISFDVPTRDQVHACDDEVPNPYANCYCIECGGGNDDALLLLCDMCDAAAHTYCVGLGRSVPTGNWYCSSCEESRTKTTDAEAKTDDNAATSNGESNAEISNLSLCEANVSPAVNSYNALSSSQVSIHDIISSPEPRILNRLPFLSKEAKEIVKKRETQRVSLRLSNRRRAIVAEAEQALPASNIRGSSISAGGANTLFQRRLLQDRIHSMRENWKALQSGNLQFSSRAFKVGGGVSHEKEKQKESQDSQDAIDKAWSMMERARSTLTDAAGSSSFNKQNLALKSPISARDKTESTICMVKKCTSELPHKNHGAGNLHIGQSKHVSLKNSSSANTKILHDRQQTVQTSLPACDNNDKDVVSAKQRASLGKTLHLKSPSGKQRASLGRTLHLKSPSGRPSTSPLPPVNTQPILESITHGNSTSQFDDSGNEAKEQVLTAVKSQLKPIYKTKKLGSHKFKEAARISTHTVLTACGYSQFNKGLRSFERVSCSHPMQQRQSPSLLTMCCSTCFDSFVRRVVQSVVEEVQ